MANKQQERERSNLDKFQLVLQNEESLNGDHDYSVFKGFTHFGWQEGSGFANNHRGIIMETFLVINTSAYVSTINSRVCNLLLLLSTKLKIWNVASVL